MMLMRVSRQVRRGRGRGDRDAALLLLDHPVHRRGAVVHLAHLVHAPGVKQNALGAVVLPASMCAAMPIFRVRSSGYSRTAMVLV